MAVCVTDTYLLTEDTETGETCLCYYRDPLVMYDDAARIEAFSDCSPERVLEVVDKGRKVEYVGWRPGMHFIYCDVETHEVTFEDWFPRWDH